MESKLRVQRRCARSAAAPVKPVGDVRRKHNVLGSRRSDRTERRPSTFHHLPPSLSLAPSQCLPLYSLSLFLATSASLFAQPCEVINSFRSYYPRPHVQLLTVPASSPAAIVSLGLAPIPSFFFIGSANGSRDCFRVKKKDTEGRVGIEPTIS